VSTAPAQDPQAFLLHLSDELRPLADPAVVQRRATELLGACLGASRTRYVEISGEELTLGASSAPGLSPLNSRRDDAVAAALIADGRAQSDVLAVDAVAVEESLAEDHRQLLLASNIGSFARVCLRRGGQRIAAMTVQHPDPRRWTTGEVALLRATTEQTWSAVQRTRTEAALRDNEERLRLVFDSIGDFAIVALSRAGMITSWNSGAARIFGYATSEALGRHFGLIFTPQDRDASVPQEELLRAAERGRADDERWHLHKSGERVFVSGVVSPLRRAGTVTGYVKVARDTTSRKYREDMLRLAHEELEERVRDRTSELADLAVALQAELVERETAEERIKSLFTKLVSVQEEERRRIAREVHDQLGQQMTALRMGLERLRVHSRGDQLLAVEAERTAGLARELDDSIDFLTWGLRPASLDHLGLGAAIETLVRGWSERFGIRAEYHARDGEGLRLEPHVEINIYRIVQEALHNVFKHARAQSVGVMFERNDTDVKVTIEDDGRGFDVESVTSGTPSGLGLVSMRERLDLLGGALQIESRPEHGTTLYVRVPTEPAESD
jgi:PAS domain S-box-containing protein